jgi:20S proteasome alpha/beta subunit
MQQDPRFMSYGSLQANAIGRSSKTVREFLEKNHKDDMTKSESVKLTVKSLLEVVQTGAKNIEISVLEGYRKVTVRNSVQFSFDQIVPLMRLHRVWV